MIKDAILNTKRLHRICVPTLAVLWVTLVGTSFLYGQASPGEHKKHHPGKSAAGKTASKGKGGMMGGKGGGMMGGKGKGGGMGGMMEKMGAPKPKDLYPRLMALPNLPMEERSEIERAARQRMLSGTALLAEGLETLSQSAANDDFTAMQQATATMREGLAQFESGLAARRALAEGKAPRNVALKWFKREMNLLPPAAESSGFRIFGMTLFHTGIMAGLLMVAVAMIGMYFFKMRRATALLEKLTTAESSTSSVATPPSATTSPPVASPAAPAPSKPSTGPVASSPATSSPAATSPSAKADDCCEESAVDCAAEDETTDGGEMSQGLLRVTRKKLCRLRVARIFQETVDVKTFRLVACHGGAIPFSYLPGQFLTLTLPTGEKPIRRSYTISSSPTQGYYCEISVKREDKGAGSRYLHDTVTEGDTLEVQAPSGKFIFTGKEADGVVLIAGGVGITPMMSIARALTDMSWSGDINFIVSCRDPEHFIFESELKSLEESYSNLHLFVAMSRIEQDTNGYRRGRLSKELLAEWVPDIASKWIQLCGAPPMMDSTKQMLTELDVPGDSIHTENFGSLQKPRVHKVENEKAQVAETPSTTTGTVAFQTSGKSTQFLDDETILEAAERVDIDIDNSCRVGMCGVCVVKLLSGKVSMEVDDGLEPEDKAAGMILACQAKSAEDVAVDA